VKRAATPKPVVEWRVRTIGDFEHEARRRRFWRDLFAATRDSFKWDEENGRRAERAIEEERDLIERVAPILESRRVRYRVEQPPMTAPVEAAR